MMHYRKGENVEKEISKDDLPFKDCVQQDTSFLWMHVKGGTKVHNVIDYARKALDKGEHNMIIWSGQGGGVIKTVSCAEILKRYYELHQVTRTNYVKVEEHWLPQKNGLEEIIVTRQIPSIHILQSLTKIDDNVRDVQQPNVKTEFWPSNITNSSGRSHYENKQQYRGKVQQQQQQQQQKRQRQKEQQQQKQEQSQKQKPHCSTANGEGVAVSTDDAAAAATSSSSNQSANQMRKTKRKRKPQEQTQVSVDNISIVQSSTTTTTNKKQEAKILNKTIP